MIHPFCFVGLPVGAQFIASEEGFDESNPYNKFSIRHYKKDKALDLRKILLKPGKINILPALILILFAALAIADGSDLPVKISRDPIDYPI